MATHKTTGGEKMTAKEILETKEVFTVNDMMTILAVGKGQAYKIMRGIKSYKDTLQVSGRIFKGDYIAWTQRLNRG